MKGFKFLAMLFALTFAMSACGGETVSTPSADVSSSDSKAEQSAPASDSSAPDEETSDPDVANMLLFFASDESRAITGQTIVTDFGSTL